MPRAGDTVARDSKDAGLYELVAVDCKLAVLLHDCVTGDADHPFERARECTSWYPAVLLRGGRQAEVDDTPALQESWADSSIRTSSGGVVDRQRDLRTRKGTGELLADVLRRREADEGLVQPTVARC